MIPLPCRRQINPFAFVRTAPPKPLHRPHHRPQHTIASNTQGQKHDLSTTMVLYYSCNFCMHTVNCRLEHYRDSSPALTPPLPRRYTLPPSPASYADRDIGLSERSSTSSSSGNMVIRESHGITSPESPNWHAYDGGLGDVIYIAAGHSPDPFEDEPGNILFRKPYSADLLMEY